MRHLRRSLLGALLTVVACGGQPSPTPEKGSEAARQPGKPGTPKSEDPPKKSEPATAPTASTTPAASTAPTASTTPAAPTPAPGPVELSPPIPPFELGMMDHAFVYGWSKDGTEFGYCGESATTTSCEFAQPGGKRERTHVDGEGDPPAKRAALEERLKDKGYATTNTASEWEYGADLVLSWKANTSGRVSMQAGALMRGETETDYAVTIATAEEYFYTIHPEAIALSPDGAFFAVLSHAYGGEYSDTFQLEIVPVAEVASRAYNKAGLENHRRGQFQEAAALFQKAIDADPSAKWPYYNLACARVLQGESGAEEALSKAIEIGGAEIKEKAKKDKDFEKVRVPISGGLVAANRIRALIENGQLVPSIPTLKVTISAGVAGIPSPKLQDAEALISAADQALYEAKRSGRNRVCTHEP